MLRVSVYQAKPGGGPLAEAPGQACDQCRKRKSRCNRGRPACASCLRHDSLCSYVALPKRRGPIPRSRRSGKAAQGAKRSWDGATASPTEKMTVGGATDKFHEDCYQQIHTSRVVAYSDSLHALGGSPTQSDTGTTSSTSQKEAQTTAFEASTLQAGFDASIFELGDVDFDTSSSCWPCTGGETFQLPPSFFEPYLRLFVDRLYPIFPVIDCQRLMKLVQAGTQTGQPLAAADYALLTSLSAAVVVQLNLWGGSFASSPETCLDGTETTPTAESGQPPTSAQVFATHCLQARRSYSFIEEADEWTIMTSFFLFAYYGNLDESRSAWYYLREAIGFAQSLGLDDEDSYMHWDTEAQQRRRRLFWLLFITERAYAIQQRRPVMLRPSIDLPKVFEARDPKLIYGFVMLARVFKSIHSKFISAWMLPAPCENADDRDPTSTTLIDQEDLTNCLSVVEMDETQQLDVLITQQWLRALLCQLHIRRLRVTACTTEHITESHGAESISRNSIQVRILDACKNLLQIVSRANMWSLEAHGIGMEQKISDAANCLCDFFSSFRRGGRDDPGLSCTPDLLHSFMVFLGRFRNHESQYLGPLVQRSSALLALELKPSPVYALEEILEGPVGQGSTQQDEEQ